MAVLTTKVKVLPDREAQFPDWQASFHRQIAALIGFVSLEIVSVGKGEWLLVQRFASDEALSSWQKSAAFQRLFEAILAIHSTQDVTLGVTEVFVTEVNPGEEDAYRSWIAKIHQAESKFPGFRGVYVQSPLSNQKKNWITLLHFDTPEQLDAWLTSLERKLVLKEAKGLIKSLEDHRLVSSYGGWFSNMAKEGDMPPVWKQTMCVLLLLFPIVMLELKYLSPLFTPLGSSLSTFICNAISLTLIAWPLMSWCIKLLDWWLRGRHNVLGILFVLFLYVVEIVLFSGFL